MEHICTRCEWSTFDNVHQHACCPKCGAPVNSYFDEEIEYDYDAGYEPGYDEDESEDDDGDDDE